MNYTENYSLPQWEDSDRVTRSDVNGAMSAIDSAIAAACPLVKLLDYTSPSAATSLTVDLSGINFMDYWQIFMYVDIGTHYARMRFNGVSSGYKRYQLSGAGTATTVANINLIKGETLVRFYPVWNGSIALSTSTIASTQDGYIYVVPATWADWNSVTFYDDTLPAGSKVVMYGIRK